ncbi:MAG: hypothetical protein FWF49_04030, partial [Oscillospiraceae bacterium]|nr:hypothetical protein [Oscillospiraceae bacterium]
MASSADILFLPGANANAPDGHPTYFSLHHVHEAHALTKGVDVKVGVIDWFFGADTHASLYAGCRNFTGEPAFLQGEGHGLWMASALREMAPECEIYALCVDARGEDEARRCRLLMDAMAWAADNGIQILT